MLEQKRRNENDRILKESGHSFATHDSRLSSIHMEKIRKIHQEVKEIKEILKGKAIIRGNK
jgi:hypothetical protein